MPNDNGQAKADENNAVPVVEAGAFAPVADDHTPTGELPPDLQGDAPTIPTPVATPAVEVDEVTAYNQQMEGFLAENNAIISDFEDSGAAAQSQVQDPHVLPEEQNQPPQPVEEVAAVDPNAPLQPEAQAPTEEAQEAKAVRIKPQSAKEREAFEMRRRNPDMPFEDILAHVGITTASQDPAGQAPEPEPEPVEAAPTVEELREQLVAAQEAELEGTEAWDNAAVIAAKREQFSIQNQIDAAAANARVEAETESVERQSVYNASLEKATAAYPQVAEYDSVMSQTIRRINDAWGESLDPRFDQPNKLEQLAKLAADQLGIQATGTEGYIIEPPSPHNPQTPLVPTNAPAPVPVPGRPRAITPAPAPGNLRTTPATPPSTASILAGVTTEDDFAAAKARMGFGD